MAISVTERPARYSMYVTDFAGVRPSYFTLGIPDIANLASSPALRGEGAGLDDPEEASVEGPVFGSKISAGRVGLLSQTFPAAGVATPPEPERTGLGGIRVGVDGVDVDAAPAAYLGSSSRMNRATTSRIDCPCSLNFASPIPSTSPSSNIVTGFFLPIKKSP
jgi:hypothetical protein